MSQEKIGRDFRVPLDDITVRRMTREDLCARVRGAQLAMLAEVEDMEATARHWNRMHPDGAQLPETETELRAAIRALNIQGEVPVEA